VEVRKMAKLTEEMKKFFNEQRDPHMVFIGTSSKAGTPNVVVKGTFIKIVDDETMVYADIYSDKTLKNIAENPQVAMAAVNCKTFKGYQFKGKAEVIKNGPLFDEAQKSKMPQLKSVTRIKVEEIYLLDYGPNAGKKLT
jgi:predicted pyridoxine 5'-phosphate oxidase superfamily flavin-nucleotide-binding protein